MKLVRYGRPGKEKPGLIDELGRLRSLAGIVDDITPAQLSPQALKKLAKIDADSLPLVRGEPRFGVPLSGVGKFIAIGLNYADHAEEAGMAIPPEPIVFSKAISCLSGPDDPIRLPPGSKKTDWEVELGVVIGSRAQYVDETEALQHVAGYCVVNDVSERAWQLQSSQWDKGKGADTFGPVGPWLVTPDEILDVQDLDMYLEVNGKRMQTGSTATMIFGVAQLVSYLSRYMTLEPGDIIATGTPPGVGMGRTPPRYLKAGDSLRLGIPGLGEQQQVVEASPVKVTPVRTNPVKGKRA
ncbi:MAG TPA: fumarylacetoacetate hydrolase family protein [Telluria sp.]|nr:fumarylacetoacetate hydrolase family protein [Telluria sp.]